MNMKGATRLMEREASASCLAVSRCRIRANSIQTRHGPIGFVGHDHQTFIETEAGPRKHPPSAKSHAHMYRCSHGDVRFVAASAQVRQDAVFFAGLNGVD